MGHEPNWRSVKLLVRKGRKRRKGKAPRTSKTRCRSTMMQRDETEKPTSNTWTCGPSAITRRKARRASQPNAGARRSEEHTSELQSLMRISYAVFCLKKKKKEQKQKRMTLHTNTNNNQE